MPGTRRGWIMVAAACSALAMGASMLTPAPASAQLTSPPVPRASSAFPVPPAPPKVPQGAPTRPPGAVAPSAVARLDQAPPRPGPGQPPASGSARATTGPAGPQAGAPAAAPAAGPAVASSVPSAPQNFRVYPSDGSIAMLWAPPADTGSPPLDSYYVYIYNYPEITLAYWITTRPTDGYLQVTGLPNRTYVAVIYAHNAAGFSPATVSSVYTQAGPPSAPRNLVATAANASGTARWSPPVSDGGMAVDFYLVAAYDLSGTLRNYMTVCGTCTFTPYTPGLANGVVYYLSVFAHNPQAGYGPSAVSNYIQPGAVDPLAGAGERADFTFQSFALTDRMTAKVNVGTGNLELSVTDLALPGAGGGLPIGRSYNSLAPAVGSSAWFSAAFGYDWSFSQSPDVRLVPNVDGSVAYHSPAGNVASFAPNGSGFTTPAGLDATLIRNGDGTYTLTYHAASRVMRFAADGNLLSDADRNANTLSYSYPDGRRVTTITSSAGAAPGNTVSIDYSGPNGRVASLSQTADGTTRTVRYTYDPTGVGLTAVADASGTTSYVFDGASNLSSVTDVAGRVTQFSYDSAHRVTSLTRVLAAGNSVTRYDYTTPGHTRVTDALGHPPLDYTVDGAGRVTSVLDAKGQATATTYTPDAKVATFQNAGGGRSTNTYGANTGESLTASAGPTGATVGVSYADAAHPYLPDSATDAMGNHSTFTYSGPGNLTASANATAATARLSYNADGSVATATDPKNNVTAYAYNGAHQLTTVTPPAGNSLRPQSFSYDGYGRLKTATAGSGVVTTYSYDASDRVTGEAHSDATPALSYGYDTAGNLTSRADASGATTYGYDAANHLTTKTAPGGAVLSYSYDAVGNLAAATDAGGTVSYHYDKANLLDQITEPGGRIDIFAYDADHRRSDTWYNTTTPVAYDQSGNNVIPPASFAAHIHSSIDAAGHLTRLRSTRVSSDADASRVADLSYAYTVPTATTCPGAPPGRATDGRQAVTNNMTGAVTAYCYDAGGRLTTASTPGGASYAYGYDASGNRSTGPEGAHAYNSANQATDAASAYNAAGGLTSSTGFPALAYNGIDQSTSLTAQGQAALPVAYAGAGQDERTAAGPTTYQNGRLGVQSKATTACVLIIICTTTTSSFVRDPEGSLVAERIGAEEYYYVFDGIGSVIALVDASGTRRAVYTYDPYGATATATAVNGALPDNPFRYAGGYLDTTGLYHLGARYYDPSIGRFTQQDTVVSLGDPANGNRYAYAGDDPVNNVDPSGHFKLGRFIEGSAKILGGFGAGIVGAATLPDCVLVIPCVASLAGIAGGLGAVYSGYDDLKAAQAP